MVTVRNGAFYLEPTYPIVADPVRMTITVGPRVFDRPVLYRSSEHNTALKEEILGLSHSEEYAERHKLFAQMLGPKFNRRFQAANYWLWVGGRMLKTSGDMLRQGGSTGWHTYSDGLVFRANEVIEHVNEAERDGLFNLIPAIVTFKLPPSEIRKAIGPATWRRIAHNSKTRNMRLMQRAARLSGDIEAIAGPFLQLLDFPSGFLNVVSGIGDDELMAARIAPHKHWSAYEPTVHIIRDARRMLGEINPTWSLARIQREHDEAARELRRKTYSDQRFADDWSFSEGGFTATLFTDRLAIAIEGDAMHHCVGSYAHEAAKGKYAVLKIEGKERATLGIYLRAGRWAVDQCYGPCNQAVSQFCVDFAYHAAGKMVVPLKAVA